MSLKGLQVRQTMYINYIHVHNIQTVILQRRKKHNILNYLGRFSDFVTQPDHGAAPGFALGNPPRLGIECELEAQHD